MGRERVDYFMEEGVEAHTSGKSGKPRAQSLGSLVACRIASQLCNHFCHEGVEYFIVYFLLCLFKFIP